MASVESHLRGSIGNCRCEHDASHLTYVKNSVFIRPCISRHWKSTQPPGGGDRPIRSCAFPESGCPWPSVALQRACRDDMPPYVRPVPPRSVVACRPKSKLTSTCTHDMPDYFCVEGDLSRRHGALEPHVPPRSVVASNPKSELTPTCRDDMRGYVRFEGRMSRRGSKNLTSRARWC